MNLYEYLQTQAGCKSAEQLFENLNKFNVEVIEGKNIGSFMFSTTEKFTNVSGELEIRDTLIVGTYFFRPGATTCARWLGGCGGKPPIVTQTTTITRLKGDTVVTSVHTETKHGAHADEHLHQVELEANCQTSEVDIREIKN